MPSSSSAKFVEVLSDSAESDDEVQYVPYIKPPPPLIDLADLEADGSQKKGPSSAVVVNGAQPETLSSQSQKSQQTGFSTNDNSAAASCSTAIIATTANSSSSSPSVSASVGSSGWAQYVRNKSTGSQVVSDAAQASSETVVRNQVDSVRIESTPDKSCNATGNGEVAQKAGRKSDGEGSGRSNVAGLAQKRNKRPASSDPAAPTPARKRVTRQQRARQRTNEEIANFLTTLGIFEPTPTTDNQTAGGSGSGGTQGTGIPSAPAARRKKNAAMKRLTPRLESLSLIPPPPPEVDLESFFTPAQPEVDASRNGKSASAGVSATTAAPATTTTSAAASKPFITTTPIAQEITVAAASSAKELESQTAKQTNKEVEVIIIESQSQENQNTVELDLPNTIPSQEATSTTSATSTTTATTERRISLHEEIMNTLPSMSFVRPEDGIPDFLTRGERAKLSFNITSVLTPPPKQKQPERREKKERERVSVKDLTKAQKKQRIKIKEVEANNVKLKKPPNSSVAAPATSVSSESVSNNQLVGVPEDSPSASTQLPRPMDSSAQCSSSNVNAVEPVGAAENQDSMTTSATATTITLPPYFPNHWTPAMAELYDAPSPLNFRMASILRKMPDDPSLWRTRENSYPPKPKRQNIRCMNCQQMGHVASRCTEQRKRPRCYLCGRIGHNSYHSATSRNARQVACPNTMCLNCGRRQKMNTYGCFRCIQTSRPVQCEICGAKGHKGDHCPDNWRRYFGTTSTEPGAVNQTKPEYRPHRDSYCCICAEKGHTFYHCRSFLAERTKLPLQNPRVICQLFKSDASDSQRERSQPSDERNQEMPPPPPPRHPKDNERKSRGSADRTLVREEGSSDQNRRQKSSTSTSTPKRPRCKDYPDCFNEPLPESECFEMHVERDDHKLLLQLQEGQSPHSSKCEMPEDVWVLKKRPVVHIVAATVKIPSAQVDVITLLGELNLQQELMVKRSQQPEPEIITLEDDEIEVIEEQDAIKDPLTVGLLGSEAEQLMEEHSKPNGLISKLRKKFNVDISTSKEKLSIAISKGTGEDRKLAQKNVVFWLECQSANEKFELQTSLNEDEVYDPRPKKNPASPRKSANSNKNKSPGNSKSDGTNNSSSSWSKKRKMPFKTENRPHSKKLLKGKKNKKPEPSSQNKTNPAQDNYTGNKPEFIPPPPQGLNPFFVNGWAPGPDPMNFFGGPQIPPPQPFYPNPNNGAFQNEFFFNPPQGMDFGSRSTPIQQLPPPPGFFMDNNPNSNLNPFENSVSVPNPFHVEDNYNNSRPERPKMNQNFQNHRDRPPNRNFGYRDRDPRSRPYKVRSPRKYARYFRH